MKSEKMKIFRKINKGNHTTNCFKVFPKQLYFF